MRAANAIIISAVCASCGLSPSIYWMSSPVYANETVLIAGAGLDQATAELCADAACASKIPTAVAIDSWEQSLKMVLPGSSAFVPPVFIKITGITKEEVTVAINSPDVWWATGGRAEAHKGNNRSRSKPSEVNATVFVGDRLTVFGRSLGWTKVAEGLTCIDAKSPQSTKSTTLAVGTKSLSAVSSTCFEASFETR
jgi:hypothetical protein